MLGNIDIVEIAVQYVCLLFALCIHEASHAAMANRCGDPSARLMGRLSLNPLVHIDPIGTVVMPLLMMTTGIPYLIGWAKPVPVNPANFNNMRRDQVLVALAGPGSNLVTAFVAAVALRITVIAGGEDSVRQVLFALVSGGMSSGVIAANPIVAILTMLMVINIALLVFNLLPIPPLDGGWVLHYFLPAQGQRMLEQFGQFGILFIILIGRHLITIPFVMALRAAIWFMGLS